MGCSDVSGVISSVAQGPGRKRNGLIVWYRCPRCNTRRDEAAGQLQSIHSCRRWSCCFLFPTWRAFCSPYGGGNVGHARSGVRSAERLAYRRDSRCPFCHASWRASASLSIPTCSGHATGCCPCQHDGFERLDCTAALGRLPSDGRRPHSAEDDPLLPVERKRSGRSRTSLNGNARTFTEPTTSSCWAALRHGEAELAARSGPPRSPTTRFGNKRNL